MSQRFYVTTAIPYVNARPHIGFAMEIIQADVLARHRRLRGDDVRFQTGTDDNSLKNVQAAEAEGVPTQEFVDRNAEMFKDLREPLDLSFDDFIMTSSDSRHAPGVERLWNACQERGDLYKQHYEGLYCVGCEQFYAPSELIDGKCPEHGTVPQLVSEENWFFRLSKYADQLRELITSGELRIEPASRRNEVLGFINTGLADFSVSRSKERARGWGVPVPGDDSQVMYVWYDALGNYISALDFGANGEQYQRYWTEGGRRVHCIGKGIIRFHAVYWPAMLLSAGQALPTEIFVHDYLTVDGRKIGKSMGNAIDPVALTEEYGTEALRWWLLRDVPRVGDADFTLARLVNRANEDLSNGFGNLTNRVVSMVHKYRDGAVPELSGKADDISAALLEAIDGAPAEIDAALDDFDFRRATAALWNIVDQGNKLVESAAPWTLAKAERNGDADAAAQLDVVLGVLVKACRAVAHELQPFLPRAAQKLADQTGVGTGRVAPAAPVFPRLELAE
ncbi:MAG: methionine--tRNA ligase [Corynebacteriales bacterium]|nr:methionine--tRNA ligase [Mycobacteriales bacterium]